MRTYSAIELELMRWQAVQDYLLSRGGNDEEVNEKIRELNARILEEQKNRNR